MKGKLDKMCDKKPQTPQEAMLTEVSQDVPVCFEKADEIDKKQKIDKKRPKQIGDSSTETLQHLSPPFTEKPKINQQTQKGGYTSKKDSSGHNSSSDDKITQLFLTAFVLLIMLLTLTVYLVTRDAWVLSTNTIIGVPVKIVFDHYFDKQK